jgi:twitching motility protein PilT
MFPGTEQNRIKMSLSSVLQGIVSQRLVRTVDNKRMAAVEILVKNARIENLILEGRDGEIPDALREGKDVYKSQTFDQSLLSLYAQGLISKAEALNNATSKNDLKMALDFYDANEEVQTTNNAGKRTIQEDKDIIALKK